jgi:hypothetical protein
MGSLSFVTFFAVSLKGFFPLLGFPMAMPMETREADLVTIMFKFLQIVPTILAVLGTGNEEEEVEKLCVKYPKNMNKLLGTVGDGLNPLSSCSSVDESLLEELACARL